jgi:hypothetical protein
MIKPSDLPAQQDIPIFSSLHSGPAAAFELGQPWAACPENGFQPALVHLLWTPTALHLHAKLTDDEIITQATGDNQKMWELGDVLEMFLMLEGHSDYIELHVTPENHRLHLHLPWPRGELPQQAERLAFEQILVCPVGFTSETSRSAMGWDVKAVIPCALLGLSAFETGQHLRLSFCRYDAATGTAPILSTTSPHPIPSFHRPAEWARVVLNSEG